MIGSWLGATVMYWAARLGQTPLVMRYGRYVFIPPEKIEGAERWAAHYGSMGIFISRLLPVVRHLIGIPAGIVRMNYKAFSFYTLLGSGIWCAVLCYVGIKMGQDETADEGRDAPHFALAGRRDARAGRAVLLLRPSPHESEGPLGPRSGAGLRPGDAEGPVELAVNLRMASVILGDWSMRACVMRSVVWGLMRMTSTAPTIVQSWLSMSWRMTESFWASSATCSAVNVTG